MATYDIGNNIRITATFTNPLNDDVAVDPVNVYCTVRSPEGVTNDYKYGVDAKVTKASTGVYYIEVPLESNGMWYVRWWGVDLNGKAAGADEVQIKCAKHQAM